MRRHSRSYQITTACAVGILILLSGTVGTWLQCRDQQLGDGEAPDAVYLVCGARDQDRRLAAVQAFIDGLDGAVPVPQILIGNDVLQSRWSPDDQRNLSMSEWASRKLGEGRPSQIVPGHFYGTYGEMEALAKHLAERGGIDRLALVTSPYHARRCVVDLGAHLKREIEISVIVPAQIWSDRAPWRVAGELLKILRDRMGWSRAPVISRRSWVDTARALGVGVRQLQLIVLALLVSAVGMSILVILKKRPTGKQ